MAMAGVTYGLVYQRPLTWARASIGASLFVSLMLILFGIIPNEWLTLTQSTLEWTPQKTFFMLPSGLVLNNEVSISYAAVKDMIVGGYSVVVLIVSRRHVQVAGPPEACRRNRSPNPSPSTAGRCKVER